MELKVYLGKHLGITSISMLMIDSLMQTSVFLVTFVSLFVKKREKQWKLFYTEQICTYV